MKIQYASDLHIEFPENRAFLKANPLKPVGDILVLAGDIVPFAVLDKHVDFFNYLSANFENTYWIAGNHEYYHYDLADKSGVFHEKIKKNVHLLNNNTIMHDDVELIFTTLWSKISPANQWAIFNRMNDFRLIKHQNDLLSIDLYNQQHEQSFRFLTETFATANSAKKVVVTHHVPTFMNYPENFRGDALNEVFAVELFDFIEQHQPELWIYGHTHGNVSDFNIGKTRLATNQLGYVRNNEHAQFNNGKIFEI
ncbi:MAG: metallophosphoesterase [Prolixibacteraceae bacterium]|nr:metallophosphoesterase [Prolixibacteraceae bacterium]